MKVSSRWYTTFTVFVYLTLETQNCPAQASLKRSKTTKSTGSHYRKNEVKKEKRFMFDHVPKGPVLYSFVTDRYRYIPRKSRFYRGYIIKRPLIVRPSTENAKARQDIPYKVLEVEPTYHQTLSSVPPIGQPLYYYPALPEQETTAFEEPFEDALPEYSEEFPGLCPNNCSSMLKLLQYKSSIQRLLEKLNTAQKYVHMHMSD